MTHNLIYRVLSALLLVQIFLPNLHAQTDTLKVFTEKEPLVYEDAWDLWPYTFLNDKGEPDGYNIDLIKMLMKELNIPYTIKLKSTQAAFNDLRDGKSDLMFGLAAGFNDTDGLYGKNALTLFTQSVATPKNKPVEIKTFRDLGKKGMKVIVSDSSLCHHLMIDYGWEANAIPQKDIREAIQQVSSLEEGQIVWNTLSLKWLINRYRIDNLELTPVNMPHGEYKFMSRNQQLLDRLDEAYTKLYTADKIQPLQDKWFYPEQLEPEQSQWIWYEISALILLAFIAYAISYRLQSQRIIKDNIKRNNRLALILQTSHVRIWTYDIAKKMFTWHNENGQIAYTYSMEEFAQRYHSDDFPKLKDALERLSQLKKSEKEEEVALSLRAKDAEDGDTEERDYYIALSVMSRDKEGRPTVIIGTKKDVTDEQLQKRLDEERTLRYWNIFYTPMVGIILFDKDGYIIDINPKACEIFDCDPEAIISEHIHLRDLLGTGDLPLEDADGYHATQIIDIDKITHQDRRVLSVKHKGKLYNEFQLMTVKEDNGNLLGVFAICRDVTTSVNGIDLEQDGLQRMTAVKDMLNEYNTNIDHILEHSDIRMVTYSPDSHALTIYSGQGKIQHTLTQTRCMTLVDDQSKNMAMHLLNDMDNSSDKIISADIYTTLRVKGGNQLAIYFLLNPVKGKDGRVTEYYGLLRDFSELKAIERQMTKETAKVQEVENTKNSFVKNMVQDIHLPMNTVVDYVSRLNMDAPTDDEIELRKGILDNADYLLHLIDNVLYLSRLEAHMVEIIPQERNFAELFESQCVQGWSKYQNENTRYIVESPYDQLVVNIDTDNLAHAIEQVTANAAQYTKSGTVRARYDYIGQRLMISVDDTGEGIPQKELVRLNEMATGNTHTTKGLGLSITKELISQMGGSVEINSEEGSGTTVYITIPCHASVIKRKRMV